MRRAMAEAEVGDDGFGDDPTVARHEARFAELTGKEAAVFTPSGTMANQIALRALAAPGSLVVAGRRQHVVTHEAGAVGLNQAAQLHLVPDDDGTIDPQSASWRRPAPVAAATGRVRRGHPLTQAVARSRRPTPFRRRRCQIHWTAPIFNAAVATGTSVAERCAPATTVMACLSKGLGAPVGSLLAGPAEVIARARVERKRMGGTMRQVGVLAAAGLVALDTMVDRLAEDHRRARRLAEAVVERWPDAGCDPAEVHTNVVLFRHPDPAKLLAALAERGVGAVTLGPRTVRFVTHAGIDDAALEVALRAIEESP